MRSRRPAGWRALSRPAAVTVKIFNLGCLRRRPSFALYVSLRRVSRCDADTDAEIASRYLSSIEVINNECSLETKHDIKALPSLDPASVRHITWRRA